MMARPTGRVRWAEIPDVVTLCGIPHSVHKRPVLQQELGWSDGDTYWEDVPTVTLAPTLSTPEGDPS